MAKITFQSIDTVEKTVTVEINGSMVTRPLPESALMSEQALTDYMSAYVAGLHVEFPDQPTVIDSANVPFTPGQIL